MLVVAVDADSNTDAEPDADLTHVAVRLDCVGTMASLFLRVGGLFTGKTSTELNCVRRSAILDCGPLSSASSNRTPLRSSMINF